MANVRIVCNIRSRKTSREFAFCAKWVVDYAAFQQNHPKRWKWLAMAIERDWYPQILAGKETRDVHLILEESRWDDKITGIMDYTLEVLSSDSNKWKECARYRLPIDESMYESHDMYVGSRVGEDHFEEILNEWGRESDKIPNKETLA